MGARMQLRSRRVEDEPRFVVGMDAHAHKLAVSVWDWSDRFNACLHREIKCVGNVAKLGMAWGVILPCRIVSAYTAAHRERKIGG